MPAFSPKSLAQLQTAHPDLQRLFVEVVKHYDCVVLEGSRTLAQQEENVRRGVSKTMDSRHLDSPARAIDVAPAPLDWNDKERFYHFGGFVQGMATALGIGIRWGGDWDSDRTFRDQTFHDLPHFELR